MIPDSAPSATEKPGRSRARLVAFGILVLGAGAAATWFFAKQPRAREVQTARAVSTPETLRDHCEEGVGPPRVLRIGDNVLVAVGYDLANTMLITTPAGHVVVDVGMSPSRAREAREALLREAPGAIRAIVLTHSHIDHIGGATAWMEEGTEVWATEAFRDHFIKQYGAFRMAETVRGARQFGWHVHEDELPCSALGRRADMEAAMESGIVMPTRTFSGEASFEVGGVRIELVEAHGETHDQLFVWLPDARVLMPGDNYYRSFPNLYTIRGTSPRPVDAWIASLDAMRARRPLHLVPSHTVPLEGEDEIAGALTRYRDGIQWVRDRVVAQANQGVPVDRIAEEMALPVGLAEDPALAPLYGQLDWSARAIYGSHLGWFDGRPEALYPVPARDVAVRSVRLMGGPEAVRRAARAATDEGDPRWALHLLVLLRDAGELDATAQGAGALELAAALEAVGQQVGNSNGRGYLLESANELRDGVAAPLVPRPAPSMLDSVPIAQFFEVMASRLIPELSSDTHECVHFVFEDTQESFYMTVRRGVAELVEGDTPLPGTPTPIATVHTRTGVWRRLAADLESPVAALASGDLRVEGDALAFQAFTARFRRGL
ncbi:MAG: MBL fold metallo-hydrolase [Sandaracinaceae bacterium]|jgi:alkyl sulfatase BDS1-like metallo-beta-lactamase superfamily hydrolase|nr:MBL fold metallo-hydrolase [Sandaracinaceae bacterium]MBK7776727.1 MBL fold metallo-hydrolase [Sandaracinaceae bacterium]MBK8409920.1 MBL fold metallo-hydrolase [Sandaracinaceae bacterium]MBK8592326.1 MBL fold metallo-hydrolase [Sandaracinaceae bacterium]